MGLWVASNAGPLEGLISGVVSGTFYGGLMSLILGTWHIAKVQKLADQVDEESLDVIHEEEFTLRMPAGMALGTAIESINKVKKGLVVDVDPIKGIVNAKRKMHWNGWGDRIRLDVTPLGDELTRIKISSRPILKTMMVDNGSNLDNVMRISKFLEEGAQRLNPGNQSPEIGNEFLKAARPQKLNDSQSNKDKMAGFE